LKYWLKEETRTRKLKAEMDNVRTQIEQCFSKDAETQTKFLKGFPRETQTETTIREDTVVQTKIEERAQAIEAII